MSLLLVIDWSSLLKNVPGLNAMASEKISSLYFLSGSSRINPRKKSIELGSALDTTSVLESIFTKISLIWYCRFAVAGISGFGPTFSTTLWRLMVVSASIPT